MFLVNLLENSQIFAVTLSTFKSLWNISHSSKISTTLLMIHAFFAQRSLAYDSLPNTSWPHFSVLTDLSYWRLKCSCFDWKDVIGPSPAITLIWLTTENAIWLISVFLFWDISLHGDGVSIRFFAFCSLDVVFNAPSFSAFLVDMLSFLSKHFTSSFFAVLLTVALPFLPRVTISSCGTSDMPSLQKTDRVSELGVAIATRCVLEMKICVG